MENIRRNMLVVADMDSWDWGLRYEPARPLLEGRAHAPPWHLFYMFSSLTSGIRYKHGRHGRFGTDAITG